MTQTLHRIILEQRRFGMNLLLLMICRGALVESGSVESIMPWLIMHKNRTWFISLWDSMIPIPVLEAIYLWWFLYPLLYKPILYLFKKRGKGRSRMPLISWLIQPHLVQHHTNQVIKPFRKGQMEGELLSFFVIITKGKDTQLINVTSFVAIPLDSNHSNQKEEGLLTMPGLRVMFHLRFPSKLWVPVQLTQLIQQV